MKIVNPNPDQLEEVFAGIPSQTPIVMVNLLKFREMALYKDGTSDCSGRDAYHKRYGVSAFEHVTAVGGELIWMGQAHGSIIAPEGEGWDEVLLVRYPSIEAFIEMAMNPDYQKCAIHRTAALEDSRLIATVEGM